MPEKHDIHNYLNVNGLKQWILIKIAYFFHEISLMKRFDSFLLCLVLTEWCSLVGAGRRLEEVCMWLTAVVDRLVVRNTTVSNVGLAVRIFVKAWTELCEGIKQRGREARITYGGEFE